ncbi:MAG: hypothetical protein AAFV33_02795 [Chloroflexota bacterium]
MLRRVMLVVVCGVLILTTVAVMVLAWNWMQLNNLPEPANVVSEVESVLVVGESTPQDVREIIVQDDWHGAWCGTVSETGVLYCEVPIRPMRNSQFSIFEYLIGFASMNMGFEVTFDEGVLVGVEHEIRYRYV